ncbi:hypothetical protein Moror_4466 [Moniliophthora roreri MCA 2997]|uniref:C2H2-type domain-containing protein n=1 Tax=Moniliophthora roreri (strain MCA 2997) TaxID=1381753 RepID=V2XIZ3_MONRO|nr:hypothetical protein Moror_4466 [Moniliophthora roreri MCA 2997]
MSYLLALSDSVAAPPTIDVPSQDSASSSFEDGAKNTQPQTSISTFNSCDDTQQHWDIILKSSALMSHAQIAISPSVFSLAPVLSFPKVLQNLRVAKDKVIQVSIKRWKVEAKYICNMKGCGQTFTAQHNLKNYRNSHLDARPYGCPRCGKSFVTTSNCKCHGKRCRVPGSIS